MLILTYPWMLLLLALPILCRRVLPAYRESRPAVRIPFMAQLSRLTGQSPSGNSTVMKRNRVQWFVLVLAWLGVVTALARPQWLEEPLIKEVPMRDLLVALDLSGSMDTRDFTNADGDVINRLDAAKQVLGEFLARRDGDRVGLILFGSAAFVQVPFTEDLNVVRALLDEVEVRMVGPRTMLGDAMGLAINLFEDSEVSERVLIILTDGNDTGSLVPPERAAEIARDSEVTVHTIAMGDPTAAGEAALDEKTLDIVASTTGGDFFRANDREELESIYRRLDDLNPRQVETLSHRPRVDMYAWPLAVTLLASMIQLLLSVLPVKARQRSVQSRSSEAG
jgi:Ca-activated chloride channel family protein